MKQPASSQPSHRAEAALSSEDLRGLMLPVPTPFDFDGEVKLSALGANLARWSSTGVSGYVILGSTGERVHLDEREYLAVVEAAREKVGDGRVFIVGAGQESTVGTVRELKRVSAAVPPDAFLVITPHFYRPGITQDALLDHYRRVADESPKPVILYSMPALTGVRIDPETAAQLSEHENLIGIKDSSADIELLRQTASLVRKDFAVLTGNGTVLDTGLIAGACGAILAVGCVAPELCLAIVRAVKLGDVERAAKLQAKLSPLAAAVTTRYGLGGLKAALDMKGWIGGSVRAPLRMPDVEACGEIRRCLEEAQNGLDEHSGQVSYASDI